MNQANILVIDDNPINLGVAVNSLEDQGFNVLVASNGESGIKRAKYAHPSIILLDISMPGLDGFETCRRLKQDPETQTIPVIFMTAFSDAENKVKGLEVGAVDYVTKPIQIEEVTARINLHLKLYLLTQKLEQQVEQRTIDLNAALQRLQTSQLQLIQHEKMSALGQLMSGITHEINNPLGFVSGNLNHAVMYVQDLVDHLKLYQEKFPEPGGDIEQHAIKIELDYLLEDLPEVLNSTQNGIKRLQDISSSMRIFSRADQHQKVTFDLHEGIDSTLLILKHRLKSNENRPEITVIKKYGNVPQVSGFPGQLNQVFMNLIANAIDVFDEMAESMNLAEMKSHPFQIIISTEFLQSEKQVMIKIQDNGRGMSAEVKTRMFDHLFTTKPVGKGTGLGLSISRQIIEEKHNGNLTCKSELEQGTEFTIILPV
ncbi:MAG: hybrid sensor histidine kinase/response regulator [Microcoleaceae cyanobacterium]